MWFAGEKTPAKAVRMCCGETPHNNRHRRNTPAPAGVTTIKEKYWN